MSRADYDDDCYGWDLIRWRGAVKSAIRGRRGQAFLKELREVLLAMPDKRLIGGEFQTEEGEVCALGAVARARGLNGMTFNDQESEAVAHRFGISDALAREIMYWNDGSYWSEFSSPEERYKSVLAAVEREIVP